MNDWTEFLQERREAVAKSAITPGDVDKSRHVPSDPPTVPTILEEALACTSGPRQRDYDHPKPNHERIAALWNAYMESRKPGPLAGADVARMMILLKVARDIYTPKRDNWVDIAGYARCLERIYEETT